MPLAERLSSFLRKHWFLAFTVVFGFYVVLEGRLVRSHGVHVYGLAHVFDKMHATNRTEAVMRAISLDWIAQNVLNDLEDER